MGKELSNRRFWYYLALADEILAFVDDILALTKIYQRSCILYRRSRKFISAHAYFIGARKFYQRSCALYRRSQILSALMCTLSALVKIYQRSHHMIITKIKIPS
ncbi:hypothetical protein J2R98_000088 [Alkalibacillus filiformis]|uniref:Uncharacterized protein n=1 Tax=Alkalibacillus filiformis TaxID=200990 RepID=A0ABU0DPJ2_9BACI|nr:hypothetical protein [Alkalibacillus filiformis]MDQ0350285.1 hypothetical protein [Alkalibacillus filiformis]